MAEPESESERVHSPPPPPPPDPNIFSSGTYVVQIPKDQIYRVPPPENALIIERHRNPSVTSSRRRSCCLRFFIPILVLVIFIILLAILLPPLLTPPKPPIFKLTKFKLTPSTRKFHIDLNILNQNSVGSISFKSPSRASLFYRKREIAATNFPLLRQEHDSQRHVGITFRAKSSIPKELERRLKHDKSKLNVAMSLKMNLPAQTIGRFSSRRNVKFVVVCSFTVNTLGKNSRILSQNCESERQ